MNKLVVTLACASLLLGTPCTSLSARPPRHRIPPGYHWGRCLLVVEGKTRISGRCAYSVGTNGDFHIEGARQIYGGIDYPKAEFYAQEQSNDYWADIFRENNIWTGYGNHAIEDTHGSGAEFGPLRRKGSCWTSKIARICLSRSWSPS